MLLELILYGIGAVYMTMPPPQQCTVGIPTIYIRILFQHFRTLITIFLSTYIHGCKRVTGQGWI